MSFNSKNNIYTLYGVNVPSIILRNKQMIEVYNTKVLIYYEEIIESWMYWVYDIENYDLVAPYYATNLNMEHLSLFTKGLNFNIKCELKGGRQCQLN